MGKIWNFISSASHSRTMSVLFILILFAAVPLTVFVAQQQQQTQQHADTSFTQQQEQDALNALAQIGNGKPLSQSAIDTLTQDPVLKDALNVTVNLDGTVTSKIPPPAQEIPAPPVATETQALKEVTAQADQSAPGGCGGGTPVMGPIGPLFVACGPLTQAMVDQLNKGVSPTVVLPSHPYSPTDPDYQMNPDTGLSGYQQRMIDAGIMRATGYGTTQSVNSIGGGGSGGGAPPPATPTCQGAGQFLCNNQCYGVANCPGGWQCDLAKDAPVCPSLIGPTPTPVAQCIARYVSAYCTPSGSCQWAPLIAKPECSSTIVSYYLCFGNSQSTAQTMAQTICSSASSTTATTNSTGGGITAAAGNTGTNGTTLTLLIGLDGIGSVGDRINPKVSKFIIPVTAKQTIQATIHVSDNKVDVPNGTITTPLTYDATSGLYKGHVIIPSTITGTHDIRIGTSGHVIKKLGTTLGLTNEQTLSGNIVAGDINGDNQISILDYSILVGCWLPNTNSGQAMCGTHQQDADLNGNGIVDQLDYNLFLREYSVQNGD